MRAVDHVKRQGDKTRVKVDVDHRLPYALYRGFVRSHVQALRIQRMHRTAWRLAYGHYRVALQVWQSPILAAIHAAQGYTTPTLNLAVVRCLTGMAQLEVDLLGVRGLP
jgi:hypothetical protein